jgi:hypothetical protein
LLAATRLNSAYPLFPIFAVYPVHHFFFQFYHPLITFQGAFENRALRTLIGPKRDEVTGEWRKLHNEKMNDLYSLPNIVRVVKSRRMRWAWHVARMGEDRGVYRVLVGKPERKRPLRRPRRRWEDNIKMDLQEVRGGVVGTGWSWLRIETGGGHLWVR